MPAKLSLTKSDTTRQSDENATAPELSQQQENAVALLLQGKSDGDVAKAVGVTRQTVNGWRNHDAVFIATLNARRQELWESQSQRLRGLVDKAIDVLEKDLEAPDMKIPQSAAVHILRACGLYGAAPTPAGPGTVEEVTLQQRMDAAALRVKKIDADFAELGLGGLR